MIYTIGHKENYLKSIANSPDKTIAKCGRRAPCDKFPDGYTGGYAFLTIEDANKRINEAYLRRGFAVFGLDTTWENTTPSLDGWWHNLIEDADIIVLEAE